MRRYQASSHSFFDDLVAFLGALVVFGIGVEATRAGVAKRYTPNEDIYLEGHLGLDFRFHPYHLMATFVTGSWPTYVDLEENAVPARRPVAEYMARVAGTKRMHTQILSAAFVRYFEAYRPAIEATHGRDPYQWPAVWNFARVIRNAFSHGGNIHFQSPSARPVAWKTVTYGPSDEGRPVLFNDLGYADIIVLMEEMNSVL